MSNRSATVDRDVTDLAQQEEGQRRIDWAAQEMPVMKLIEDRFRLEEPLKGINIAACLHVTTETARLVQVLRSGGATVRLCASNPLTTQDDVAAAVASNNTPVFARRGENNELYYQHIHQVLEVPPMITMDDGANVVITEVDPLRALEAVMDGYRVMPMSDAAKIDEIFVTATGDLNVIDGPHIQQMRDGAILANSGHFNVEINISALEELSRESIRPRQHVTTYVLGDGRRIHLLAEGRLVNLSAAEGHPSAVMDMSFANQALCVEWLAKQESLAGKVHKVPAEIDQRVAELKLKSMGLQIDALTEQQREYRRSCAHGT